MLHCYPQRLQPAPSLRRFLEPELARGRRRAHAGAGVRRRDCGKCAANTWKRARQGSLGFRYSSDVAHARVRAVSRLVSTPSEQLAPKRVDRYYPDWRTMEGMARGGESLTKALEEDRAAEKAHDDAPRRVVDSWRALAPGGLAVQG
jgi:hypothetical protein